MIDPGCHNCSPDSHCSSYCDNVASDRKIIEDDSFAAFLGYD